MYIHKKKKKYSFYVILKGYLLLPKVFVYSRTT